MSKYKDILLPLNYTYLLLRIVRRAYLRYLILWRNIAHSFYSLSFFEVMSAIIIFPVCMKLASFIKYSSGDTPFSQLEFSRKI